MKVTQNKGEVRRRREKRALKALCELLDLEMSSGLGRAIDPLSWVKLVLDFCPDWYIKNYIITNCDKF